MIRLAIADDHQSLVDGIKLHLDKDHTIDLIGTASNGQELIELVQKKKPHVIMTDIRMPILDGISATQKIKAQFPKVKIIALSMFDQQDAVKQMLDAGADGYILKNASLNEVVTAIKTLYQGKTYFDSQLCVEETESKTNTKRQLTRRQEEILRLIGLGKTSREIADELFIGVYTVETHRKNIMRALGLTGRGELLRYALDCKYKF